MTEKNNQKPKRIYNDKNMQCKFCGNYSAIYNGNDRIRCKNCGKSYKRNSKRLCYNKKEMLVLKTLLTLFETDTKNSTTETLKDFVKRVDNIELNNVQKYVSLKSINNITIKSEDKILDTELEKAVLLTKDNKNRFVVFPKLFRQNRTYYFKDKPLSVHNVGDKYYYQTHRNELDKKMGKI